MKPGTEDQTPTLFTGGEGGDTDAPTIVNPPEGSADTSGNTSPDSPTVDLTGPKPSPGMATMGSMMEEMRAEKPPGLGLATKYFVMAAGLILATMGSAFAITAYRANVVANKSVRDALSQVGQVWKSFKAEREMSLQGTIRTLADEPQTRALLAEASVTPETVKDWAADKTTAAGASFLAVLDAEGAFIARSDKPVEEVNGRSVAHAAFVKEALRGMPSSALVREGAKVFLVAASPVESGEGAEARLEGVLFAGYPLDAASAKAVAAIAGTDATFLAVVSKEGEAPRLEIVATTLAKDVEAFVGAMSAAAGAKLQAGEEVKDIDLAPGRDHVIAAGFPLRTGSGDVIGAFVASRSLRSAKAAFTQIQMTLALVGIVSLIISIPASYVFGQRIAKPLMKLAASAHAIREGNLEVKLPEAGGDEVGILARSFAQMVGELKEKAELEKFVAGLGVSSNDITQGRVTPQSVKADTMTATGARKAVAADAKLDVGSQLGDRYVVDALLGQGGMGSVWRARDKELEEEVALKVIRADMMAADPKLADQLKEEIKLARRITHPNVLRTHDFGDLDGIRFISMEFVAGPTLRTVIDRRGPLALPIGLQLGRQICRGLAAAHEAGVIHRDIKPHNVIIAHNGVAKIMDFGIACAQERHDAVGGDGQVVGTPDYMSPEQIEGHAVDERADIYAVGIVLYEMFTGIRPFHASTTVQTLMRNLNETPEPLRRKRPDLPQALEDVITQATAKRADDRIQSASALRKALGKISSA